MAEKEYIERESAIAEVTMMAEDRRIPVDSYCGEVVGEVIRLLREIPAADVRPVVVCANCEHNNRCLTQEFVDDCGKIPLDRNTFFCADGERRSNA